MTKIRLRATPRLMTAYLIRINRRTRPQLHWPPILLAGAGLCAIVLLSEKRERVVQLVEWLRQHLLAATGLATIASAIAVARRRVRARAEFARSWLAALPMRARTATWETLLIEMFSAVAGLGALAGIFFTIAVAAAVTPGVLSGSALAAWAAMSAGVAAGAMVSYAIPNPKLVDLPPGSRYVPHVRFRQRRIAKPSALRPSLKALGF